MAHLKLPLVKLTSETTSASGKKFELSSTQDFSPKGTFPIVSESTTKWFIALK